MMSEIAKIRKERIDLEAEISRMIMCFINDHRDLEIGYINIEINNCKVDGTDIQTQKVTTNINIRI